MTIQPRTIAITGAASGIGAALAKNFATEANHAGNAAQLRLALSDINGDMLSEVADACRQLGCTVIATTIDIADSAAVVDWAEQTVQACGVPDEVHHVAGISLWGDARSLPHEKWQRVVDINLMGSIHIVEAFANHLCYSSPKAAKGQPRRKLVFVSSAAGIIGLPWHAAYSASKGGVMGLCEVLRFDLRPFGVDIHVVAPGAVDTPLVRTIDIHGVDRANPRVQKATALFQRHAVSPEQAAASIRKGVNKGQYLITTSRDIRFARWAQVNLPWAYRGAMRGLNAAYRWAAQTP